MQPTMSRPLEGKLAIITGASRGTFPPRKGGLAVLTG